MTKHILIVDDSKTMREMVYITLKNAGFRVAQAEDGVNAIDVFNSDSFDLIITDLNMPNLDGFGFIEYVRLKNNKNKYIPILVLTTESDEQKKQKGREIGATGWIVKPFNPEKLVNVIQRVCV